MYERSAFKVGDDVYIGQHGPVLTIVAITPPDPPSDRKVDIDLTTTERAYVVWFDTNHHLQQHIIPTAALTRKA